MCKLGMSILALFVPIFASRLAWVGMKTTDTALLGHVGTTYLSASSLADFWTGAFSPFMMDMVLGSKAGPAFGAKNYDMVGIWSQVSLTLYTWMTIPIMLAFCATRPALRFLYGSPEPIPTYAGYYAVVLALCLPARLIGASIAAFFNVQAQAQPSMVTSVLAVVMNLGLGLQFVLGVPLSSVTSYGFEACPVVTTCVEWFSTLTMYVVYCLFLGWHKQCWSPNVSQWSYFRDVFLAPLCAKKGSERFAYYNKNISPHLREYVGLALPANLSLASDFWRMSLVGLLAGRIGPLEVGVFNASYRIAWMNMTVIGAFSTASCTQLGIALGTADHRKSKRIVSFGITAVATFLALTVGVTVYFIEGFASIFSDDRKVVELFVHCRYALGLMMFFMNFSMHFEQILLSIGKSTTVAKAAIVGSWAGQVPAVVLMLMLMGQELQAVYLGVGIGYVFYFLIILVPFCRVDWEEEAKTKHKEARKKEITDEEDPLKAPLVKK